MILVVIIYQDLKTRSIHGYLLLLFIISIMINGLYKLPVKQLFEYFLLNLGFMILQLLGVFIYFFLKSKKITVVVNRQLGLGDIILILILCFSFSPLNYILFIMISLVLTLCLHSIFFLLRKGAHTTIPLAGYISFFYVCLIIVGGEIAGYNIYSDILIENWMLNLYD